MAVTTKRYLTGLALASLGMGSVPVSADYALNMRTGVTQTSQAVYDIHMIIFWICVVIGVVVFRRGRWKRRTV